MSRRRKQAGRGDVELTRLVAYFEVANRAAGKSPRTVHSYNQRLTLFLQFLEERGLSPRLRDVGLHEAREFVLSLQTQTTKFKNNPFTGPKQARLSPHYIRSTVQSLRAFFHWVEDEDYWPEHKLAKLAVPKAPRELVRVLTKEEIQRVLNVFDPRTDHGARDLAIFTLLFDRGPRASEVAGLRATDVAPEEGWIRVLGKGAKERVIYLGAEAVKALMHYRDLFRPEPAEFFFLTLDGRPLTYNALKTICRRTAQRSGVARLTLHLARHTFATWFLVGGGSPLTLQRILGHTTLTMTNYYVHLAESMLELAQRGSASPLDGMTTPLSRGRRRVLPQGTTTARQLRLIR